MDVEWLHDLRLPLQLIQSGAQMARLALEDPTLNAAEYLDLVAENAAQLRRMLDGAMASPGPGRVDVCTIIKGLCGRCRGYTAQRGVALEFHSNADRIELLAEEPLLARAALNLIMNALRLTPSGGRVAVRCAALGDYVEISVRDGGPGIAPERLPYLFLKGETDGGAGYGLPSAMDCAEALGGSIAVESTPGDGATFTLRLPVRAARAS